VNKSSSGRMASAERFFSRRGRRRRQKVTFDIRRDAMTPRRNRPENQSRAAEEPESCEAPLPQAASTVAERPRAVTRSLRARTASVFARPQVAYRTQNNAALMSRFFQLPHTYRRQQAGNSQAAPHL